MTDTPTLLRSLAAKTKYRHTEADDAMVNAAAEIERLARDLAEARKEIVMLENFIKDFDAARREHGQG